MPRVVRNFWIEVDVDGRKQKFASGPRAANGGINVVIKMRKEGEVVDGLFITCGYDSSTDELTLVASDPDNCAHLIEKTTTRDKPFETPVEQLARESGECDGGKET